MKPPSTGSAMLEVGEKAREPPAPARRPDEPGRHRRRPGEGIIHHAAHMVKQLRRQASEHFVSRRLASVTSLLAALGQPDLAIGAVHGKYAVGNTPSGSTSLYPWLLARASPDSWLAPAWSCGGCVRIPA